MSNAANTADRKVVVRVFDALLEFGAASAERIAGTRKLAEREVRWALHQLGATKTPADTYVLPDSSCPLNWQ